ncbi:MAG: aldo/keto reductase [Deltaproteobacteria bacterium]|nr:aldo/keto reductase [Deltaproteobacteria bacterium]
MTAAAVEADSFTHKYVRALDRRVHRLGLAASYGIPEAGVRKAFDAGVQYVFWNPFARAITQVLKSLKPGDREKLVIATGPTLGFTGGSVRARAEKALKILKTDYLDVFQLFWLGKTSAWTAATERELVHLKESGKVRVLGVSIHDRERAGRLALDSPLDLFMIRYNAAHPGAERDIFPHLSKRQPAIVAYTATDWRKLLKRPSGWKGNVPTAGDCYRFCLSNPHVDIVLNGPKNTAQFDENLAALEKGPLSDAELEELRALGKVVHG